MGYCFLLQVFDSSGNWVKNYEYAGSYTNHYVWDFLDELHALCNQCWCALPEEVLLFLPELEYDIVECSEILESLDELQDALEEGKVKWTNKSFTTMFKDFHKTFKTVVNLGGHIKQTCH